MENNPLSTLQQIYSILRNHYVVPESNPWMKELLEIISNIVDIPSNTE